MIVDYFKTAHPSKAINDFMLSAVSLRLVPLGNSFLLIIWLPQNPHARIAITEDKDWSSVIIEVSFPTFLP
jgi:hypothetical protein